VKFGFRASFVALLLAGVVLGGVGSSAEVLAGRLSVNLGGVCVREGARDKVAGKQVVCILNVKKQLRWRLVKAKTVRVVTGTTSSTSVASTTTVAITTTTSTSTTSSSTTTVPTTSTTSTTSSSTTTTSVVVGDRTAPVVTLGRSTGSAVVATLTFTVTGNEPIRCSTLSSSEGVDFVFTRISRINSIVQSAEDVCTISVQSTAEPGDTNARESTLAAASTFSVSDTAGNVQSVLSGSPQTIWVQRIARPVIALSATTETVFQNVAMNGYTVTSSGGTIASYSLTGTLPAGLSFSTTTGRITGTSTATQTATTYTITATNTSGSGTATFTLTVVRPYEVGDPGPGGGIVFYVAGANFTSTGSDCNTTCRYLEAAPNFWGNSSTVDNACATPGTASAEPRCVWSGVTGTLIGASAQGTAVGTGYANTQAAVGQAGGGNTAGRAITASWDYTNNGKSDWHLPSKDELNELCKYARNQNTGTTTTACDDSRTLRTGFEEAFYWSSSETIIGGAWVQYFLQGNGGSNVKGDSLRVRPVRAFG
jgi:hypothetical protein